MAKSKSKITDLDLYLLLDVSFDATEKEVIRAYRKRALKCHPDKNPDNPKAAEDFHQLTQALEVLSDSAARAAYDKALKAKKAAELRYRELNSKRQKLKDDLDSRERAAQKDDVINAARSLEAEIERLRKEGSRLVEEEQIRLVEQLKQEQLEKEKEGSNAVAPRLRVKWKSRKGDPNNGGYSQNLLQTAFSKYGVITAIVVSSKKCGSAIVEYESSHSAVQAMQLETGLPSNPLTLGWLSGQPVEINLKQAECHSSCLSDIGVKDTNELTSPSKGGSHDFESLVFRRMRQAEERKKLITQMQQEDKHDS